MIQQAFDQTESSVIVGWQLVDETRRSREVGLEVEEVFKVDEGRPNIVDHIKRREVALIINTLLGRVSHRDEQEIRQAALQYNIPCVTTMTGARAIVEALGAQNVNQSTVHSLQELHALRSLAAA